MGNGKWEKITPSPVERSVTLSDFPFPIRNIYSRFR